MFGDDRRTRNSLSCYTSAGVSVNRADASLRSVRRLRGFGALAVAAILAMSLLWAPVPASGGAGAVAAAVIALFGGVQLWLAGRTPAAAQVRSRYVDPNALPLPQRIRYFRRMLLLSSLLFPVLSAWF